MQVQSVVRTIRVTLIPSSDIPVDVIHSSPPHTPATLRLTYVVGRVCSDECARNVNGIVEEGSREVEREREGEGEGRGERGDMEMLDEANGKQKEVDVGTSDRLNTDIGDVIMEDQRMGEIEGVTLIEECKKTPCLCQWKVWVTAEDGHTRLTGKVFNDPI